MSECIECIVRIPPDMPYEIRAELNAWYIESEPIVRCRDCKWLLADDLHGDACRWFCRENDNPDGFCAWGVRRAVDDDLVREVHGI